MSSLAFGFIGGDDEPVPSRPKPSIVLRPYQVESVDKIFEQFEDNRSTLLVLATGLGKTTCFSEVARAWPERKPPGVSDRVLVLAHRWELVDQARKRIKAQTGEQVDIEQAGNVCDLRTRIVVGSVQTLARESRLGRFSPDHFGLIIVDEAHHYVAPSFRAPLEHFSGAKLLGVTATPDRGDRLALGKVFDSVSNVYDIAEAIHDQWLAPITPVTIPMHGLDFSKVSTVAGDLNQGELDEEMAKVTEGVAKAAFDESHGRQTVIFTTSIDNAKETSRWLNQLEPGCARHVNGTMQPNERRSVLEDYAQGRARFLVNVMIATEGWDDPPTSCVVIGRPTKSRALFTQMVGRGLRLHPGKLDCLVIDFAGNAGKHALVSPLDILGGKYTDDEVALAKEITSQKPGTRADEALEEAHQITKERARRKVQYQKQNFDIFGTFGIERDATDAMDYQFGRRDPTPKHMEILQRWEGWGWLKVPANLSRREAATLISKIITRQKNGWASPGQCKILVPRGFSPNLRKDVASKLIDALKANNWKDLPREQATAIVKGDA